jgi:uncharacterized protein
MMLEGVVTNVAAFGAFVDIGVHQDGLVHISALSNTFVKDPHEVVKAGQVVRVKVLEVDLPRNRIALTMRMSDEATPKREHRDAAGGNHAQQRPRDNAPHRAPRQQAAPMNNAMADALAKLRK